MSLEIVPDILGKRYELREMLGQGGMGSVYRALDRLSGQEVALKRVLTGENDLHFSNTSDESDFRFALAQEFKLLASIRHPNVIEVLDYGFDAEQSPYFTMELLPNAKTILEAGDDQPIEQQIDLVVQTLQALAYLHRRGVLHRDLKPANILVVDGEVRVLDFGLSVMRDRANESESTGTTAGTLSYMAPEVLYGEPPTEQVDLYAVGMIAYELIVGYHPFSEADVGELVNHIMYTLPDIDPLAEFLDVANIIQRLLQKDPADRYQQAKDVITAFRENASYSIRAESVATRESYLQSARLIGRETELQQLSNALEQIADKENGGTMWLVGGESGVGKSRLIDEVRTMAMVEGALVMRGHAVNEGSSPYHMWRIVFRWLALLGSLDPTDAGLMKLLAPDIVTLPEYNIEKAAEIEAQKILDRLAGILETTLRQINQPIVIILEDLHWANSESMALLSRMHEFIKDLPVLFIGSYRDDEAPNLPDQLPDVPVLKLERLSDEDIRDLSEAMLGESGGQSEVVTLLKRETEGNVFFIIEVIRALAEETGNLDDIGRMTLPENVFAGGINTIIQRRLENLPGWTHKLLQIAALMGRHQNRVVLQHLSPDANLDLWLIECANGAVLEILDGEWQFTHDKLREAIIDSLSDEERKAIHTQIAEAIETIYNPQDQTSTLAYHWRKAGNTAKEDYYVLLAGEQALRRGAYADAIKYFERAIGLLKINATDTTVMQMRLIYLKHRKAEAYLGSGEYDQAEALYQESLELSETLKDQEGSARAIMALGDIDYVRGNLAEARQHYQQSLSIFRANDNQRNVARLLNSLGNVAYDTGDEAIARQLYQQSIDLSRELGSRWGMAGSMRSATTATSEIPTGEIREQLEEELRLQKEQNNPQGIADAYFALGMMAFQKGDYDAAYSAFEQALALREQINDLTGIIAVSNQLGDLCNVMGNYGEARQYIRQALTTSLKADNRQLALESLLNLANLYVSNNQTERAVIIVAFIASSRDTPDTLLDRADELALSLEASLGSDDLAAHWEQGKSIAFDDVIDQALAYR